MEIKTPDDGREWEWGGRGVWWGGGGGLEWDEGAGR